MRVCGVLGLYFQLSMFFWLIIWAELICSPMGKQVQQPPGELGSGTSINPNTLWPNTARLTWRPKLCHTSKGWINFWFRNPMQQENLLLWIGKHLSVLWIPFLILLPSKFTSLERGGRSRDYHSDARDHKYAKVPGFWVRQTHRT